MPYRTARVDSGIDWERLAREKYRISGEKARAGTLTAQTGAAEVEKRYGHGSRSYGGLAGEELSRRFPYGLPATQADTARITARGYAGSAISGAKTAAGRLALEREESVFSRKYLEGAGEAPGSAVKEIRGIAERTAKPGRTQCPEGYYHNGTECVPLNPGASGAW